ncbi:hypothetical protein MP638_002342 [Amoeboaphelidium occidentale]|nr:hypothetical protein MP638_002342 [Amoeboaphelidium occidentale]
MTNSVNKVTIIQTAADYEQAIKTAPNAIFSLNFCADWAPQCNQMNDVFQELASKSTSGNLRFLQVDAEEVADISDKFDIVAVPSFVFVKDGKVLSKLNGANPAELSKYVDRYEKQSSLDIGIDALPLEQTVGKKKEDINARLTGLTRMKKVMLFIKGTPDEPKCGFTRQLIEIMRPLNIPFGYFDILSDEEVRQNLKEFANWPTYPQVWVNGELVGGLDIIKELQVSGELEGALDLNAVAEAPNNSKEQLNKRLEALIKQKPVMLFMKGSPDVPQCGFSRKIVDILRHEVKYDSFGHFDILSDEDVRQGLKEYSDWPTYPQLYIDGELVGGLDIVDQLVETGELQEMINQVDG